MGWMFLLNRGVIGRLALEEGKFCWGFEAF